MLDSLSFPKPNYLSFHYDALQDFLRKGEALTHHDYGFPLRLLPGVYPSQLRLSYATQMAIDQMPDDLHGKLALDMGAGAGPIALAAAYRGAKVIACDHNPQAVALARANVIANGLNDRVEVIESDVFKGVFKTYPGMRFDLVAANLWFLPQICRDARDTNQYHVCLREFLSNARDALKPNGMAILTSSSTADITGTRQMFAKLGIAPELKTTTRSYLDGQVSVDWHAYRFGRDGKAPAAFAAPG